MPEVDGRRRRAERNQAAVIDALLDLFREGQLRPGAALIAARAGVSERTVFRLFDDLEALAAIAVERQIARMAPLLRQPDASGSQAARITALVAQRLAVYQAVAPVFRAGQMRAPLSSVIRQAFARRRRWTQRDIERQFGPELAGLAEGPRTELVCALDAATSLEVIEYLSDAGTVPPGAVLARSVRALLAAAPAQRHERPGQSSHQEEGSMSVSGTWNLTLNTPMGAQNRTLVLSADGAALTGTIAGPQGNQPIEDGRVDGDDVSWSMMAPQLGAKLQFKGTVAGDSLSGSVELGAFGSASFSGVRA